MHLPNNKQTVKSSILALISALTLLGIEIMGT